MSSLEISLNSIDRQDPEDRLKSNTHWFHIFQALDISLATFIA